jgi:hypothetical protein
MVIIQEEFPIVEIIPVRIDGAMAHDLTGTIVRQ